MNKLLATMLTIGFAAAMVGTGTIAMFSDTEVSAGNTFTAAGPIDLTIDWDEYYNGEPIEHVDETSGPGPIFTLSDVKPGDYGEATISLHVYFGDAKVTMKVELKSNDDVSSTEPELKAGDSEDNPDDLWDGELAQNIDVTIWWDADGDNEIDDGEKIIKEGKLNEVVGEYLLDADPTTTDIDPFKECETYYVGFSWSIPESIPGGDINIIQTDKCTFDITFTAEQEVS